MDNDKLWRILGTDMWLILPQDVKWRALKLTVWKLQGLVIQYMLGTLKHWFWHKSYKDSGVGYKY
jgi:hypothetical protein